MIFITVGTQKFPFDRLLKAIDKLIDSGDINEQVYAQIGSCKYLPTNYSYDRYLDIDTFNDCIHRADLVVTHGGTGSIITAMRNHKKIVAVARLARFGEHVDNHQLEIIRKFEEMDYIEACRDISELRTAIRRVREKTYRVYGSNTDAYIKELGTYIYDVAASNERKSRKRNIRR